MKVNLGILDFDSDYTYKLNGKPFTGIAYEKTPQGQYLNEASYKEGVQDGVAKEWYSDNTLRAEENYLKGAKHGVCKEWFRGGKLKSLSKYEFGILVNQTEWDENENVINEYKLSPEEPAYNTLKEFRKFT